MAIVSCRRGNMFYEGRATPWDSIEMLNVDITVCGTLYIVGYCVSKIKWSGRAKLKLKCHWNWAVTCKDVWNTVSLLTSCG